MRGSYHTERTGLAGCIGYDNSAHERADLADAHIRRPGQVVPMIRGLAELCYQMDEVGAQPPEHHSDSRELDPELERRGKATLCSVLHLLRQGLDRRTC